MEFLKWPEKPNKPNIVATTAKHSDSHTCSQVSGYGWMQQMYMYSVSFWKECQLYVVPINYITEYVTKTVKAKFFFSDQIKFIEPLFKECN